MSKYFRMSPTGFDWGRKLLTREMLHMPSRYCWAWMVTELRAPLRVPLPTVTWTLGLAPGAHPRPLCCSATCIILYSGWGILDIGALDESLRTLWVVTLVGCPVKILEGRAGKRGKFVAGHWSWRACRACSLNCCTEVEHTWHLAPSCSPCIDQSGTCNWSKRNVAKPGS